MNLFIIPGNPPALHFYQLWAKEIQSLHAECSIHISPYPHIQGKGPSLPYLDNIAEVHGREFLAFQKEINGKVAVIGHSLGAWMALRVLEKHHAIIENCVLLYPFLRKPTLKARIILKMARHLHQIPRIEKLLSACRSSLEKLFKDLQYVSDKELSTCLALAYHEHRSIGLDQREVRIPDPLRKKLSMFYCDQDKWCPERTIKEMQTQIVCKKVTASHGFITSAKEREAVLKALLNMIL